MDSVRVEAGTKWVDADGRENWVESVRGAYCRVAKRLAARQIVRRIESLEKVSAEMGQGAAHV